MCSGATLAERPVDEAASMDVAWMLARRPLQWQSSLLRAAMGNRTSGFNPNKFVQQLTVPDQYGKFYIVCFVLRENINNIKCANFTVV